MLLPLFQVGEPVLREKARSLTLDEIRSERIQQLIESMHETLRAAPGVGLAAPQIGERIQLAIVEDLPEYARDIPESDLRARERKPMPFHLIINPKIKPLGDSQAEFFEGCLSLAGFTALVPRWLAVEVECLNEQGERRVIQASGWYARILQHEIDHLNGRLYIDRMESRSFMSLDNYKQYWKGKSVEEVKKHATGDKQ